MKEILGVKELERKLRQRSVKLLRTQWQIGPLPVHRKCSALIYVVNEDGSTSADLTGKPHGSLACHSNSCRPGDPFGCSMTNARLHRRITEKVLSTWLSRGHVAYVGQLEVVGAPDQSAAEVMDAARAGFNRSLAGTPWTRMKNSYELAGKIMTLSMSHNVFYDEERWIVRRQVIIGGGRELDESELAAINRGISDRWLKSIDSLEGQVKELRPVVAPEVGALAQLITGCFSPVDPPEEPFAEILKMEFTPIREERSASDLAETFRRRNGARGSDFIEYAETLARVPVWSAQRSSPRSKNRGRFTIAWDDLLKDARSAVVSGQLVMKKKRAQPRVRGGKPKKV